MQAEWLFARHPLAPAGTLYVNQRESPATVSKAAYPAENAVARQTLTFFHSAIAATDYAEHLAHPAAGLMASGRAECAGADNSFVPAQLANVADAADRAALRVLPCADSAVALPHHGADNDSVFCATAIVDREEDNDHPDTPSGIRAVVQALESCSNPTGATPCADAPSHAPNDHPSVAAHLTTSHENTQVGAGSSTQEHAI